MFARLLRVFDVVFPAQVALVVAVVGASLSTAVVATTLPSGGPYVPTWVAWPLFLGIFPVHARSIRTLLLERAEFKERLLGALRPLLAVAAVLGACTFALVMLSLFASRGNPERHGGAYYLRNHTDVTRVTRSEYRYEERLLERTFVGGALIFYLAGVLVQFPPRHVAGL